jgi:hypothetical protein
MKTSNISIAFASDLHLPPFYSNRRDDALYFPPEADVIILAGDIAVGNLAAEEAFNLAERYPKLSCNTDCRKSRVLLQIYRTAN